VVDLDGVAPSASITWIRFAGRRRIRAGLSARSPELPGGATAILASQVGGAAALGAGDLPLPAHLLPVARLRGEEHVRHDLPDTDREDHPGGPRRSVRRRPERE